MKTNLKVTIKNIEFNIACEAGEEEKIRKITNFINRRVILLADSFPGTNLMTLFLLNAIMMEDEISELKDYNIELSTGLEELKAKSQVLLSAENQEEIEYDEITSYVESLIEKIEN